ncbi:MAG: DNA-3-methyladenine glycosylase [Planctomycetota bacterium]
MTDLARLLRSGAEAAAPGLLGCVLRSRAGGYEVSGRIVETEAYLPEGDAASHSFRGETKRCRSMFARAGTAYVYLIYGMHRCFNVATGAVGRGEAVLIRALEPLEGVDAMRARRGDTISDRNLCRGPGRLAQALGIELEYDGVDLLDAGSPITLEPGPREPPAHERSARIGITKAADLPLRFVPADPALRRFASRS